VIRGGWESRAGVGCWGAGGCVIHGRRRGGGRGAGLGVGGGEGDGDADGGANGLGKGEGFWIEVSLGSPCAKLSRMQVLLWMSLALHSVATCPCKAVRNEEALQRHL